MKPEAPQFRIVENEPRRGSFWLKLTLGGQTLNSAVPAIEFDTSKSVRESIKEYTQAQIAQGTPVVAFRFGKQGMCGFQIHPALKDGLYREIVRSTSLATYGDLLTNEVTGQQIFDFEYIDSTDSMGQVKKPNVIIMGNFEGQALEAQIFYQPSPK